MMMPVEGGRVFIDRVDDNKLAASRLGRIKDRLERLHGQLGTEPSAVSILAQGEFRKQDRRDLVERSPPDLLGRVASVENMRCDREVTNDCVVIIQNDVCAGSLALRVACMDAQPAVSSKFPDVNNSRSWLSSSATTRRVTEERSEAGD
jgi:hypothetical protein